MAKGVLAACTLMVACASSAPPPKPFTLPRNGQSAAATQARVAVAGAVVHPGYVPYADGLVLVRAIYKAGGLLATADTRHVLVKRQYATGERHALVSVDAILDGKMPDVPLDPDDVIFVPERP